MTTPLETIRVRSYDGIHLNVEVYGNPDGPTLVLSHGWTCSIRFWLPLIAELSAEYRLVAYDQRGHGGSDRPGPGKHTGQYSVPALAEDLAAVLDAAAGPGRVILIGHSMGGMSIMAAGHYPRVLARTRAILLASTAASELPAHSAVIFARYPRLSGRLARRMLRDASPLGPQTRLSTKLLAYAALGPSPRRALAVENATIIHACPRQTRAAWGRVLELLDVREGAARLNVPTAVLFGSADRLTPTRHADQIVGLLPQLHSDTRLPGIGHMSPMEDPVSVAAVVRELDAATAPTNDAAAGAKADAAFTAAVDTIDTVVPGPGPTLIPAATDLVSTNTPTE